MSTSWAVVRAQPTGTGDIAGTFSTLERAEILLADLDDHVLVRCDEETGFRVVHYWVCHARVSGDDVQVGPPHLLVGAGRLAHRDHYIEEVEGVEAKDKESELDSVVSGHEVHHFFSYATSSDRAQELAETHIRELLTREP
ncbi:hypothetical protein [Actinokineospora sp. HUAS TT18]|uniref:hypothetical protein n=1 Tax=Actinokineospora sp. HUAS TT18 TaxID=3447451 RepID=UPI003F528594